MRFGEMPCLHFQLQPRESYQLVILLKKITLREEDLFFFTILGLNTSDIVLKYDDSKDSKNYHIKADGVYSGRGIAMYRKHA